MTDDTKKSVTDVTQKSVQVLDGFDGFEDGVEGDGQQDRVIQGSLVKFTNEAEWMNGEEALPPDRELVVVNVGRVVQKWKDQLPVETIVLEPGQKFPDLKKLNAEVPESEWEEGPDGKPRGPWQAQYLVYLIDLKTMDRFTYATGTVGGGIAVRDLVDRTELTRKFRRGMRVYPVVRLSDVFWPTRYGGRQRPHFIVERYITLDGDGGALPAPDLPKLESPPTAPTEVKPPSAKEVTDDEIKW
jgi:hypothetical protein